ncbi:MAG: hypothetical protein IPG47_17565 [Thermoflexaceae bacterium]|nr:hypothetical protein [Thermoflexaceae bacterium]
MTAFEGASVEMNRALREHAAAGRAAAVTTAIDAAGRERTLVGPFEVVRSRTIARWRVAYRTEAETVRRGYPRSWQLVLDPGGDLDALRTALALVASEIERWRERGTNVAEAERLRGEGEARGL